MHWWMLTLFSTMDHRRVEIKDTDPELAAKMQHMINEVGGRIGYAELKALDLKAMKLIKHYDATIFTRWFWRLKGKALDREYEKLKAKTWVLGQYEFESKQWMMLFDLALMLKLHFKTLWQDDLDQFFIHLNDCNMNLHERVRV